MSTPRQRLSSDINPGPNPSNVSHQAGEATGNQPRALASGDSPSLGCLPSCRGLAGANPEHWQLRLPLHEGTPMWKS